MANIQAKKKHSDLLATHPLVVAGSFSKMLSENAKLGAFGVCKAAVKVLGHRAPRGGVENG
jgi:hypothetical protein